MTPSQPVVSIICTNFNQGSWIGEALDSFLLQKTNFIYEIVIIDDASTDHSLGIVNKYADKHPNLIKAIYNKKNLGITKTWIKACEHARGKYIARCDGDDFWIDPYKLQKQFDALEAAASSKWSCTDFNMIHPDGTIAARSAFEKGVMTLASSYEDLLATKGFTMPSTWLVETKLMQNINGNIDKNAIDDTFNIQIELFRSTKLTYLPYPTAIYRIGHESISRPLNVQKLKMRSKKLLETQLEYIDKYRDVDFIKMVKAALGVNTNLEALLADEKYNVRNRDQIIKNQEEAILNKETLIKEQEKLIKEQAETINNIVNSRRYKLASKAALPLSYIKHAKERINYK